MPSLAALEDVAAAAKLVAAVSAGDTAGWVAVIGEAAVTHRLAELCLATAAQAAATAADYCGDDVQAVLDLRARYALSELRDAQGS